MAIRFSEKNQYIPNMEFKLINNSIDQGVLENRLKIKLNKETFFISAIELQIAFKLFLGSEKDIEDAKYLYDIFQKHLDQELMDDFFRKLNISNSLIKLL